MAEVYQLRKDLELAARIGQSLLEQKKTLEVENETIKQKLVSCEARMTELLDQNLDSVSSFFIIDCFFFFFQ